MSVSLSLQENPYPAVTMHKVQGPSGNGQKATQSQSPFPGLDEVTVQLFIDHATAKLKTAPPVVKAEVKSMVPSGPPLGELGLKKKKKDHERERATQEVVSWTHVSFHQRSRFVAHFAHLISCVAEINQPVGWALETQLSVFIIFQLESWGRRIASMWGGVRTDHSK